MAKLDTQVDTGWWLASFGGERHPEPAEPGAAQSFLSASTGLGDAPPRTLRLFGEAGQPLPGTAERESCGLVFDGVLYNRAELWGRLADASPPAADDAALVLEAYLRWGDPALCALKGIFALCIWDARRDRLLCARDPVGIYPLFYADAGRELLLSTSVEALIRHPRVSSEVNRAALADHLCLRWPKLEETFFSAVSRVPPGHAMRLERAGRQVYRYWTPVPADRPIDWVTDDQLEQFDSLLEQAVHRCMELGPAAIYQSGGIDSVSVASAAVNVARREGLSMPWALSLVFPDPEESEEAVQRAVATELGLPQVLATMAEAVGPQGLIGSGLEITAQRPAPLLNAWHPAYRHLALEGKRRGCHLILTGHGGDEWLDISPYLAADLLRALDVGGLYRLWDSWRHSYSLGAARVARNVLWRFGARPLLGGAARRVLRSVGPGLLTGRRRGRFMQQLPHWLAPDPALREELYQRYEQSMSIPGAEGYYLHDLRRYLDNARGPLEFEEYFENGRRLGMRLLHPFWDVDLIEFLYRIPPHLLYRGGHTKGFVREGLARKFPGLGFERQKKVISLGYFTSINLEEGWLAWQKLGGAPALAKLGIVDHPALEAAMPGLYHAGGMADAYRIRGVLFGEAWLRPRL